jgi:hypothetical protein
LQLHAETACRRGGALARRPQDLDPTQCLIFLRAEAKPSAGNPSPPPRLAISTRCAERRLHVYAHLVNQRSPRTADAAS